MVSQFLSGVLPIVVLIAVGAILSTLFKGMNKRFTFTRMALILAISPLSLVNFIDQGTASTLYLFAMIAILLGITIDGINHLLMPRELPNAESEEINEQEAEAEPKPGVIVWEKAE